MGDVALASQLSHARVRHTSSNSGTRGRLFSTPARQELAAERTPDPDKMAEFFRARSAHIDSPIFSRKVDSEYTRGLPQVRLCPDWKELDHVPDVLDFDIVCRADFAPGKVLRVPDGEIGWCVARNPLAYAVQVRFDPDAKAFPICARLKVIDESASHMFVLARPELTFEEENELMSKRPEERDSMPIRWFWQHPRHCIDEDTTSTDNAVDVDDLLVKFWAAPAIELRRGSATLELEILDSDSKLHTARFTIRGKGAEAKLKVTGPGIEFDEKSKSAKVILNEHTEQLISIVNESQYDASLLASVILEEDGVFPMDRDKTEPGAFIMRDLDDEEYRWTLGSVKLMRAGEKVSLSVGFKIPENTKRIPVVYHGYILVRVAYFLCSEVAHDDDIPQYYDYVIFLEAPRDDGEPGAYSPYTYASPYKQRESGNRESDRDSIEPRSSRDATNSIPLAEFNEDQYEQEQVENELGPEGQFGSNFPDSLYFGEENNEPSFFDANDFTATASQSHPKDRSEIPEKQARNQHRHPLNESGEEDDDTCRNLQHREDVQSNDKWPTPFKSTPFKASASAFQDADFKNYEVDQSYDFGLLWSQGPTSPGVREPIDPHSSDNYAPSNYDEIQSDNLPYSSSQLRLLSEEDVQAELEAGLDYAVKYDTCDEEIESKWRPSPTDIQAPVPSEPAKLRMPRGVRTRGLCIDAEANHVILPLQNATACAVEVRLNLRRTKKGHSLAVIESKAILIESGEKAKIRITRRGSLGGTVNVHVTVLPVLEDEASSVQYCIALTVEGQSRRMRLAPERVALDRPTLTFYAQQKRTCVSTMRVLNGLDKETLVRARVRDVIETPTASAQRRGVKPRNPFAFDASPAAMVLSGGMFNVAVKFTADDTEYLETDAAHYTGMLDVLADGRQDTVPLFGYIGKSRVHCTLSPGGVVQAVNSGDRAGFLLVHDEGRVLQPGESISIAAPSDWCGIVIIGDEIARSRLRAAHSFNLLTHEEFNFLFTFLGDFEGQELAAVTEELEWEEQDALSLHYAARLFSAGLLTRQAMDDHFEDIIVIEADRWGAYFDDEGRVRVYNGSPDIPLCFRVVGAIPENGVLPELGDGVLDKCEEEVIVHARGRAIKIRRIVTET